MREVHVRWRSTILFEMKQNKRSKRLACCYRITFGRSQTDGRGVSPSWEAYSCLDGKLPTYYGTCSYTCLPQLPDAGAFPVPYKSSSPSLSNHPDATQLLSLSSIAPVLSHVCLYLRRHCLVSGLLTKFLYAFLVSPMYCLILSYFMISVYGWE
jgi:hypothetical protein